jgi:hypothetical protein
MGACDFSQVGVGKTAQEAFSRAHELAQWEHGHGGYSGTLAEKGSFVLFKIPPRLSFDKLERWVSEYTYNGDDGEYLKDSLKWAKERVLTAKPGTKRAAQAQVRDIGKRIKDQEKQAAKFKREVGPHLDLVKRMSGIYDDKWGPACAVEITSPKLKKQYVQWTVTPKRGEKVFVFFGMASS